MTGFLGHLVPGSFESLGKIITPSLGIMLVALGVGAAVGPPHAAADAATRSRETAPAAPPGKAAAGAHRQATAQPPEEPTATPTDCNDISFLQPGTWMRDMDPCIRYRPLANIKIPGSHDSGTYSFDPDDLRTPIAQTQTLDLMGQLDAGVRQLDIRVEWDDEDGGPPPNYYAHHGSQPLDVLSETLYLKLIFSDLVSWASEPGHGQEIILINLTIDQNGHAFPTDDCAWLKAQLGANWVTPNALWNAFKKTDPGEVTLGQLWSLPKKPGLEDVARVIIDHQECNQAADPDSQPWGPFSPPGQTLFSGYYADQCFAGPSED